ncbi:hypothetical protein [Mesorhizobium sophorae]|uniref:hypothetical protein n=1 Tax=Mesorhizobium sophorae TaxID=1300294 RepID=UPI000BA3B791|nr:hypothetical protein [Mesorhizobium sophorae]
MAAFGLRLAGGGAHQSKTMMFQEIDAVLASGFTDLADIKRSVIEENILGKATANNRALTYRHLVSLYAVSHGVPLFQALAALWKVDAPGRRLLALLAALARDPLLRDTVPPILGATIGEPLPRELFEAALLKANPERFSDKMLRSLAQNCASTWTQSRHLEGKVRKIRRRVTASPQVAAFAALLATVSGFGGPAILNSLWMRVLDLSPDRALDLLRQAEGQGLVRVRSAGDVTEISVRQPMAIALGIGQLEHV